MKRLYKRKFKLKYHLMKPSNMIQDDLFFLQFFQCLIDGLTFAFGQDGLTFAFGHLVEHDFHYTQIGV